jgi:hypothetical protein
MDPGPRRLLHRRGHPRLSSRTLSAFVSRNAMGIPAVPARIRAADGVPSTAHGSRGTQRRLDKRSIETIARQSASSALNSKQSGTRSHLVQRRLMQLYNETTANQCGLAPQALGPVSTRCAHLA